MPDSVSGQVLGFDFGLRQVGIASTHTSTAIVSPVGVLNARQGQVRKEELDALLKEWKPKALVVGLPLNMDETESTLSKSARDFADWLAGFSGLPVELVDERLTSREAKAMASELGHGGDYKRNPIDAIAACLILEQWLGNRKPA